VLVLLDSMHTHGHVLEELRLYSPFVSRGSYIVVFDTIIESMPTGFYADRPWDRGNSPATAVESFLGENDRFEVDREIHDRLLITVAEGGYLRCVRD
jgi:cephalosporin hydroxylase